MNKRQFLWWLLVTIALSIALMVGGQTPTAKAAGAWTMGEPMPAARPGAMAGVINGKLYIAGGNTTSGVTSTLFIYDPVTDSWTSGANMLQNHARGLSWVINDKLYVAGGFDGTSEITTLEIYNPSTNSWSYGTNMLTVPSSRLAGVIGGKMYLVGNYSDQVDIYDPATNSWAIKTASKQIGGPSVVGVINEKMYLTGVQVSSGNETYFYSYDPTTNSVIANANGLGYVGATAGVINGKLYVAGGRVYSQPFILDYLQVYDPATDMWTTLEPMPTPLGGDVSGVINGKLYVTGSTTLQIYDPNGGNPTPTSTATQVPTATPTFTPIPTNTRVPPTATATPPTPTATPIRSGIEGKHIWGYSNYRPLPASWASFQIAFGPDVVGSEANPKPRMKALYDSIKENGGLCFGMSSTVALSFGGQVPVLSRVNPPQTYLDINSVPQADSVTYLSGWQMKQWTPALMATNEITAQPLLADVVSAIKASINGMMQSGPVALRVNGPVGPLDHQHRSPDACSAHVILPVAYQVSGSQTLVTVYDSNHGSLQRRTLTISPNSWEYPMTDASDGKWGSAIQCTAKLTSNTPTALHPGFLSVYPLNKAVGLLPLPATNSSGAATVILGPGTSVTSSSANVRQVTLSDLSQQGPSAYIISDTHPVTLSVQYEAEKRIAIFANQTAIVIGANNTGEGTDQVLIDGASLTVTGDVATQRSLDFIDSSVNGFETEISLLGVTTTPGETVKAELKLGAVQVQLGTSSAYVVSIRQVSSTDDVSYTVSLPSQETGSIQTLTPSLSDHTVVVDIDHNADGVIDETKVISQSTQTLSIFLPIINR